MRCKFFELGRLCRRGELARHVCGGILPHKAAAPVHGAGGTGIVWIVMIYLMVAVTPPTPALETFVGDLIFEKKQQKFALRSNGSYAALLVVPLLVPKNWQCKLAA